MEYESLQLKRDIDKDCLLSMLIDLAERHEVSIKVLERKYYDIHIEKAGESLMTFRHIPEIKVTVVPHIDEKDEDCQHLYGIIEGQLQKAVGIKYPNAE